MDETPEALRERSERYRRLAAGVTDLAAIQALQELADRYEEIARELERLFPSTSANSQ